MMTNDSKEILREKLERAKKLQYDVLFSQNQDYIRRELVQEVVAHLVWFVGFVEGLEETDK